MLSILAALRTARFSSGAGSGAVPQAHAFGTDTAAWSTPSATFQKATAPHVIPNTTETASTSAASQTAAPKTEAAPLVPPPLPPPLSPPLPSPPPPPSLAAAARADPPACSWHDCFDDARKARDRPCAARCREEQPFEPPPRTPRGWVPNVTVGAATGLGADGRAEDPLDQELCAPMSPTGKRNDDAHKLLIDKASCDPQSPGESPAHSSAI